MSKVLRVAIVFFVFSILFTIHYSLVPVFASHCGSTDYDCQIAEIQREIDALKPAHENNKEELANLRQQFANLRARIAQVSQELVNVEGRIKEREEDLAYTQKVFEEKADSHYRFIRTYDPLLPFLSSEDASTALIEVSIRQRAQDGDRKTMEGYASELISLKEDKDKLSKNKESLASAQASVDNRAKFLEGEIDKVENYLATLSKKQEEILAAKSGAFTASVGNSELADDYKASIKGFRESAPAGSFAVFSFGAYTHRKGMSQYGARGRAENGQNFRQILKAYYGKEPVSKDTGGAISVSGVGSIDFETTYLYGIAEMPSTWNAEALKAQAVAARTYAYRYKIEGRTICTNEACQVFNLSKSSNPPGSWKQAVDDTRGLVLEDVVTYYSSTSGGYLSTMGWDTTDGAGGSSFVDKAWENKGGSPWLYKAWYRQGYSASGPTCGNEDPWLTNQEMADIINAALILKNRNDDRISPLTTSCWDGNPYSFEEMRAQASQYGGISSVSSITVSQGNGVTNSVTVNGNITLSGEEFKKAFNLRASGYMRIPQSGFAFFNIEKK